MTEEQLERLGLIADELDNLRGAMNLPMPAQFHVDQLKIAIPNVVEKLRELVVELGGEPWDLDVSR